MFNINDSSKIYTVINIPGTWILGYNRGQMVAPEILKFDKNYVAIKTYKDKTYDVIRLDYKNDTSDNITNHYKLIYLDILTHLLVKIINSLMSLNEKQIQIDLLSDIKINDITIKDIDDKNYLINYLLQTPQEKPPESLMGKKAAFFMLKTFTGESVSLSAYIGKVILLDFWETWCEPCVKSMPELEALFEKYYGNGLVILGIMSEEKSLGSAKLLIQKKGLTFTALVGNRDVEKIYHVTEVPKYILIDEQGKIIYESSNGNEQKFEQLLEGKFAF
jgi:thiol-disulfide isomerase/thioredoxin